MNWHVSAYIMVWNREDTIHLTINHYKKFCDKVFIIDNFSTDRTREIAEGLGCTVSLFGTAGVLDDHAYREIKNNCWKGSDADFVIVVDDDEILYAEDLTFILRDARMKGQTIFKPQGYSMHSDEMPKEDWLEVTKGFKDNNYSKLCIFNPKAIKEIGYQYGCHTHLKNCPSGRVVYGIEQLYLLHYRSVGGVGRLIKRWEEYEPRRQKSIVNMKWNLGHQYSQKETEIRKEWAESIERSKELSSLGIL